MGKSIKLNNDIFWDDSSIMHDKTNMKYQIDRFNERITSVENNKADKTQIPNNYVYRAYKGNNPNIDSAEYRSISGIYGIYNCTKAPSTEIGILEVLSYTVDWCVQRFSDCYGSCWMRTFYKGTTWTSWKQIY